MPWAWSFYGCLERCLDNHPSCCKAHLYPDLSATFACSLLHSVEADYTTTVRQKLLHWVKKIKAESESKHIACDERERERAQRLSVKAGQSIFNLHHELYAKNSMTQFCLLLLLVAFIANSVALWASARPTQASFAHLLCCCSRRLGLLLSNIIYYSQLSRILLSPLFRSWQVCVSEDGTDLCVLRSVSQSGRQLSGSWCLIQSVVLLSDS